MPDSLFEDTIFNKLLEEMKTVDASGSELLPTSEVFRLNVRSFPPKPKSTDALREHEPELAAVIDSGSQDGLRDVYPDDVLRHNCGSNKGMADVCKHVFVRSGVEDETANLYLPVMTDCNLYHRMLKVCSNLCAS